MTRGRGSTPNWSAEGTLCRGYGGVPYLILRTPFLAGRGQGDGRNAGQPPWSDATKNTLEDDAREGLRPKASTEGIPLPGNRETTPVARHNKNTLEDDRVSA
jgi:hypothetical protein